MKLTGIRLSGRLRYAERLCFFNAADNSLRVIFDAVSEKVIYDCCDENKDYLVAQGGEGGAGNFRFKSSTNQALIGH